MKDIAFWMSFFSGPNKTFPVITNSFIIIIINDDYYHLSTFSDPSMTRKIACLQIFWPWNEYQKLLPLLFKIYLKSVCDKIYGEERGWGQQHFAIKT